VPTRFDDPTLKVGFGDDHWVHVHGGTGSIEITDEVVYMTISLRNAGSGIAVLHGWRAASAQTLTVQNRPGVGGVPAATT